MSQLTYKRFVQFNKEKGKELKMTRTQWKFVEEVLRNKEICGLMSSIGDLRGTFENVYMFVKEENVKEIKKLKQ